LTHKLAWLIRFRRLLGLFAFFYATLHLATWIALYAGFDIHAMESDVIKRRYVTVGMAAWVLLLPLAATSTNWAIRKLGGARWNRLHKLVYIAAVCGVIHYWWQVKPGVLTPVTIRSCSACCCWRGRLWQFSSDASLHLLQEPPGCEIALSELRGEGNGTKASAMHWRGSQSLQSCNVCGAGIAFVLGQSVPREFLVELNQQFGRGGLWPARWPLRWRSFFASPLMIACWRPSKAIVSRPSISRKSGEGVN